MSRVWCLVFGFGCRHSTRREISSAGLFVLVFGCSALNFFFNLNNHPPWRIFKIYVILGRGWEAFLCFYFYFIINQFSFFLVAEFYNVWNCTNMNLENADSTSLWLFTYSSTINVLILWILNSTVPIVLEVINQTTWHRFLQFCKSIQKLITVIDFMYQTDLLCIYIWCGTSILVNKFRITLQTNYK